MKLIFIFLVSLFASENISSSADDIRWQPERKLTYQDFRGAVPGSTPWAATTNSSILFGYETVNEKITRVSVYASFIPKKSWMKKKLPEVLGHEQLHFDITEIFARRFYHQVMKENSADKDFLDSLFKSVNLDCSNLQQQYDDETNHGIIEDVQAKWKVKVDSLLNITPLYPASQ